MLTGTWCMGIGLGNLDGWDGDHTIHVLPAGVFCCFRSFNLCVNILLFGMIIFFWLISSILLLSLGWKSSIVTGFCGNYIWSRAYTHVASGPLILLEFFCFSFVSFIKFA